MYVENCKIIKLQSFKSSRNGDLVPIYNNDQIPFNINRVYYLYDIPPDSIRGGHAHKKLQQLIVAASGSFTIEINDSKRKKRIKLNSPDYGLYIPSMIWREIINFSSGSICLVLASETYDEDDYYRNYDEYKKVKCQIK